MPDVRRTIDLHCDTVMHLVERECSISSLENTHINLDKIRNSSAFIQCFALYISRHSRKVTYMDYLDAAYRKYSQMIRENSDTFVPILSYSDIDKITDGRIGSLLTVEDAVNLDGKLENVKRFEDKGIRLVTLTHNRENSLGYPNSKDPQLHRLGLKDFGKQAVEALNESKIIVDVSHLSEGGFYDVLDVSDRPFCASHSCAFELCPHPRNLKDDQIRKLADRGGIIGINFLDTFLDEHADGKTTVRMIIDHLKYIADKGGMDILALGSDYDGITSSLEWKDIEGQSLLLDAIEKAFGYRDACKIFSGNALRFLKDTLS